MLRKPGEQPGPWFDREKSWLGPIVIVQSLLGLLIVGTQRFALAPYICMSF